MGAAWPHKLVFRVKRRLKSIFSCNQKTAIKRKHKTATQHSGRDLERRSKGAGRWRYFVPQAQNNAGTKRTLLRRDKMLQYRYFKFSIGYLEDHPTALLGRGAFAPHECFATGKTSAQGEFPSPAYFDQIGGRRLSAAETQKEGHPEGCPSFWSWKRDSNTRPADYESAALPTELFQHIFVTDSIG